MILGILGVLALLGLSAWTAGAAAQYVPVNVHDGACYTFDGNISAPASFCGFIVYEMMLA